MFLHKALYIGFHKRIVIDSDREQIMCILCLNTAHSVLFLHDARQTCCANGLVLAIHINRFSDLIFFLQAEQDL